MDDVAAVLADAGYLVERGELADQPAVLAETPYALCAYLELSSWEHLQERIFDAQAALTRVASQAPSARNWDLYVVGHVLEPAKDAQQAALAAAIEADTAYARKLVRAAVSRDDLDRALLPLLPLRDSAAFEVVDPLDELRGELAALELPDDITDAALAAFEASGEVRVP